MKYGPNKSGIRHHPRHDMEDVRAYFEKKVYEHYSNYMVERIEIKRVDELEGKRTSLV